MAAKGYPAGANKKLPGSSMGLKLRGAGGILPDPNIGRVYGSENSAAKKADAVVKAMK